MPYTPDGMTSIETTVPDKWMEKIQEEVDKKGTGSKRQFLRDLIYENFIKSEDTSQ